jgi:hypothetical protein
MNTIEFEAQKAYLAREILYMNDEKRLNTMWLTLNEKKRHQQKRPRKREIGFLEGKAKVVFYDDWSMTPEELEMMRNF